MFEIMKGASYVKTAMKWRAISWNNYRDFDISNSKYVEDYIIRTYTSITKGTQNISLCIKNYLTLLYYVPTIRPYVFQTGTTLALLWISTC